MREISVECSGYAFCKSSFYSALDIFAEHKFVITSGMNMLLGDIDSGNWAVSYLLSMFNIRKNDFVIHSMNLMQGEKSILPKDMLALSCYMDETYPLFATKGTVGKLIERGIRKSNLKIPASVIIELFKLDISRLDRPVSALGTHKYRAMAAIAYSYGKHIYCYPWMSEKRYQAFQTHLQETNLILTEQEKIVIFPKGRD